MLTTLYLTAALGASDAEAARQYATNVEAQVDQRIRLLKEYIARLPRGNHSKIEKRIKQLENGAVLPPAFMKKPDVGDVGYLGYIRADGFSASLVTHDDGASGCETRRTGVKGVDL